MSCAPDASSWPWGGIENTRLLLLGLLDNPQACYPREPLGRYFMDHPRALYGQIRLTAGVDLTRYLGCPMRGGMIQPGLGLAFDKQRALRCLNGYLHFEVARPPVVEQGYDTTIHVMKCLLRRGYAGRRLAPSLRPRIHADLSSDPARVAALRTRAGCACTILICPVLPSGASAWVLGG